MSKASSRPETETELEIILDDDLAAKRLMKRWGITERTPGVDSALALLHGMPPMTVEEVAAMEGAHFIDDIPPDPGPYADEWS